MTVKRFRASLGLKSTRQQHHSLESISVPIQDIRERFPMMGARGLVTKLRKEFNLRVAE